MRVVSLNVNSLKSCIEKGLTNNIFSLNPDIVCFQEIKCQTNILNINNYYSYWSFCNKKGYSGVAIFTKIKPLKIIEGFLNDNFDAEGRILSLEFKDFILINVYVPNSKSNLDRQNYRMNWDDLLYNHISTLEKLKPLIICGDFNTDLKKLKNNNEFIDNELDIFQSILTRGYTDSFIYKNGNQNIEKFCTWYLKNKKVGYRLDYFLISNYLRDKIIESTILNNINCSDHYPILLDIDIKG